MLSSSGINWKSYGFVFSVILALLVESGAFYVGGGFTFELEDREKTCLYQRFDENGDRFAVDMRVVRGGNNDIDVTIKNGKGTEIYNKQKLHIDKFEFESTVGTFEFCFSNEFSTFTHKQIFFNLYPDQVDSLVEAAGGKLVPRAETQVESALENIHEHMTKVGLLQMSTKSKNRLGYNTAKDLNTTVSWMAVVYVVAIIVTGLGQVLALKKLFPTNQSVTTKPDGKEVTYAYQPA
ncbi:transmembrane emp24 domain-containing protein 3-like [Tubulanus polymorphus]|uniref:transmembrane emp24 domain-containing protein 3-like n=1 Tax=Tubulanus polymorphus TaxID=672921 RepID=UPI003DA5672B